MPKATLSRSRVTALLTGTHSVAELDAALFASKAEVGWGEGDTMTVEVTPDRLDLLNEGGLGLHLQGALGEARGLPKVRSQPAVDPAPEIEVDPSVAPLRPSIRALLVGSPDRSGIDEGLLSEAVRFQEILHATVGFDRRLASLGLYPYDRIRPPFRYGLEPVSSVSIEPLDRAGAVGADRFLSEHPVAVRYGVLGVQGDRLLTFRDGTGALLSLPPILNARTTGQVRPGDRTILIEATGTRPARVADALSLLSVVFAARGWSIAPVPVRRGESIEAGRPLVEPREIPLRSAALESIAGRAYPADEVEQYLARARLSARAAPGGWSVAVPPWRPDLLQEVDVIEEVVLARGIRVEEGVLPPSRTRGGRRAESHFHDRMAELLLGSGFSEVYSPVLVSEAVVARLNRGAALRLTNPVSDLFQRLRDAIQLSLVASLERNVRSGYPQRFFELGPVLRPDPLSESGVATRTHLGAILAEEGAGFATAASAVDYLTGAVSGVGVREPVELPGCLPGRAARVRLAGEPVAELGEIHPAVLSEIRAPVPAVWFELDLTALWPLARRPGTT